MKSLRLSLIVAFVLILSSVSISQNQVPNGSFEIYVSIPESSGQIELSTGFHTGSIIKPDYFHSLSSDYGTNNLYGLQLACDGLAYAGQNFDVSYLIGKTTQVLIPNTPVDISFAVSLAERSVMTRNKLAMKLLTTNPFDYPVGNRASIIRDDPGTLIWTDSIFTDTQSWNSIKGTIIVPANYSGYFSIGIFPQAGFSTSIFVNATGLAFGAYFYIDMITIEATIVGTGDPLENDKIIRIEYRSLSGERLPSLPANEIVVRVIYYRHKNPEVKQVKRFKD